MNETVICRVKQAFQQQINPIRRMVEVLASIRSRPRVNSISSGLPDSTILIREDRSR